MHNLRSKNTIRRFKFAALLSCMKVALIPIVIGMIIYSLINLDPYWVSVTAGLVAFTLLISVLLWFFSIDVRCPLCMTPFMAKPGCAKHRRARTYMGSYRIPVATGILFKSRFTCPYCNERTAIKVRERRH